MLSVSPPEVEGVSVEGGGGEMWGRLRAALQRLLPAPSGPPQEEGAGPASRKRPPLSKHEEEEQDEIGQRKRFKMGDLLCTVRGTAQGVRRVTSEVLSWVQGPGPAFVSAPSPRPRILTARRRCGTPLPDPTPPPPRPPPPPPTPRTPPAFTHSQELGRSVDASFSCPIGEPAYGSLCRPGLAKFPMAECSPGGSGDQPPPDKRSAHGPPASGRANGMTRSLRAPRFRARAGARSPARSAPRGTEPAGHRRGSYIPMYDKTFGVRDSGRFDADTGTPLPLSSPRPAASPAGRTPIRPGGPGRRTLSTVEETILQEEKEIYRQLLEVVTADHCHKPSLTRVCSPISHRQLAGFSCLNRDQPQKETGSEGTVPDSPQSSESPSRPSSPEPALGPDPGWPEISLGADTMSTGSDSESVIVVTVKEASRPDPMRASTFDSVHWIKELISMYDSRARERNRQIREQQALAERLKQQRLQRTDAVYKPVAPQLHLSVPLIEEIPIADVPHEEPAEERPRVPQDEEVQLPELSEEMESAVRRAFQPGNPDQVLTEAFRLTITRKDIQTLNQLNWLNDEVINFYMNLLVSRSASESLPTVHAFNTFFFPKLRTDGYQAVRRWTKKVDVFAVDIVLVPVHLGVHWCLAVVDFRKRSISYYDSMGGRNDRACEILLQYLKEESLDKKSQEFDTRGWVLSSKSSEEIPQQMNGSDCGMFTCKYADYISQDLPIHFSQKHMPYFRRRMTWEILHQKLL